MILVDLQMFLSGPRVSSEELSDASWIINPTDGILSYWAGSPRQT